jgi:hypothetical protein
VRQTRSGFFYVQVYCFVAATFRRGIYPRNKERLNVRKKTISFIVIILFQSIYALGIAYAAPGSPVIEETLLDKLKREKGGIIGEDNISPGNKLVIFTKNYQPEQSDGKEYDDEETDKITIEDIKTGKEIPIEQEGKLLRGIVSSPCWDKKGERIVFITGQNAVLAVVKIEAGKAGVLFRLVSYDKPEFENSGFYAVQFSPDGMKILLNASNKAYVMNPDGKNMKQVIKDPEALVYGARWVDNKRIKYTIFVPAEAKNREMCVEIGKNNSPGKSGTCEITSEVIYNANNFEFVERICAKEDLDDDGLPELVKRVDNINDPQIVFYKKADKYFKVTAKEELAYEKDMSIGSDYFFLERNDKKIMVRLSGLGGSDGGRSYGRGNMIKIYEFKDKKLACIKEYVYDGGYSGYGKDIVEAPLGRNSISGAVSNDKKRLLLVLQDGGGNNLITPDCKMIRVRADYDVNSSIIPAPMIVNKDEEKAE